MNALSPMRVISFLQTVSLFEGVNEEDLLRLVPFCRFKRYAKGAELFSEGDPGDQMFLILEGRLTIQRINEQGQTLFIAEREAGDYIGELALIDGQPRSADVVASEPVEVLRLERDAFLEWVQQHPKAMWTLTQTITARLRETMELLDCFVSKDAMGRLCDCLLKLSRKGTRLSDNCILLERITQERLAERIYSDRATVNRLISNLEQLKAIERDGRQLILKDRGRLHRLADQ